MKGSRLFTFKCALKFVFATLFVASSTMASGIGKTIPKDVDYFGKSLMIQSTNEVVDGYQMNCTQTLPWESKFCLKIFGKSFCRFYDEWNCSSLKGGKGSFSIAGKVNYDEKKGSKLLSISLDPSHDFTDPLPLAPIFGQNVLDRLTTTAENRYDLSCEKARYSIPFCVGSHDPYDPYNHYAEGYCHYKITHKCMKADDKKSGVKVTAHVHYGPAMITMGGKHQIYNISVKPLGKLKQIKSE